MRTARGFGVIVLVIAGPWVSVGAEAQSAAACDRTCLGNAMTRYLSSLVATDPSLAPLGDRVRFTEDAVEMPVGEGFWRTASKLRPFRTDFLDVREGIAATHAVIKEQGTPVLFAARLRVVDREITEIETMVGGYASDSSGTKRSATPLLHHRWLVGGGPSSNT